jgi:nitrite reductase/ring-hydroxylating ferredoxin subunit
MSTREKTRYRVGPASLVPEESGLLVRVGEYEVGVFRFKDGYRAYENVCAHQGGPVCSGVVIGKVEQVLRADQTVAFERESPDEIHVICPWHGWEYDLENGECATDRRIRLRGFDVELEADELFVIV